MPRKEFERKGKDERRARKIDSLGNLAFVHLELGNLERAFVLLNQSRAIAEKLGEKRSMRTVYVNLGEVLAKHNSREIKA
ncbi:MAG: tetratricopeptide repeat protein [Chloroherpetonaceae bacterium]